MIENRHVRRRVAWERSRARAPFRFRIPHLLVGFLGLLALALQSFVVQTHVHAPYASTPAKPISFVTLVAASAGLSDLSLGHTDGPGGQYPSNRDSTTCPWCKELTRSGQYVASASVLATLPFPVTLNVIVFREIAPSLFAASHTWRGRAPPLA
jgi:hypothetical protein